jgi:hypothetical protein
LRHASVARHQGGCRGQVAASLITGDDDARRIGAKIVCMDRFDTMLAFA